MLRTFGGVTCSLIVRCCTLICASFGFHPEDDEGVYVAEIGGSERVRALNGILNLDPICVVNAFKFSCEIELKANTGEFRISVMIAEAKGLILVSYTLGSKIDGKKKFSLT